MRVVVSHPTFFNTSANCCLLLALSFEMTSGFHRLAFSWQSGQKNRPLHATVAKKTKGDST
jgi:hypothetical protein